MPSAWRCKSLHFHQSSNQKAQKTKHLFLPASIKVGFDNNVLNSILDCLLAHGSYLAAVFKVQTSTKLLSG